jgi:hypothetical protein
MAGFGQSYVFTINTQSNVSFQLGQNGYLVPPGYLDPDRELKPVLRGNEEHLEASTETALARFPEVIWDANGYYRSHGMRFPYRDVTVADLRRAHMELRGFEDDFLTYVLKQLRDPEVRRIYNATPLGLEYMDKFVQAKIKRIVLSRVAERQRQTGVQLDPEEALRQAGFMKDDSAGQEASSTPPAELSEPPATVQIPWRWAYYQWRSFCDDTDRLGRWQELLVEEFVKAGVKRRFVVGFMGQQPQKWVSGEVQGRLVVYLNENIMPTREMAAAAVTIIIDDERRI